MEYICINNGNIVDVMRELIVFTSSGKLVDETLEFIIRHKEILEPEEKVEIEKIIPHVPPGTIMNWISLESKYSINIRKSLIIFIMFLLDASLTKGAVTTLAGMSGLITQTIHRIEDKERCILLDLLINGNSSIDIFLYYDKECIQNDIKCIYRHGEIYKRDKTELHSLINKLIEKEVIFSSGDKYKLAF